MENNSGRRKNDANPPDEVRQGKVSRQEEPSRSTIAEKLVSLWRAGASFPPGFNSDGIENVQLREIQEKCSAFEKINAELQKKLSTSEGQIVKLHLSVKKEESEKQNLMEKMTTIWDYMQNITETMNYVTETLDDCKVHHVRLESDYNNVIVKLSEDNETLKIKANQLVNVNRRNAEVTQQLAERELELSKQREQHRALQISLENYTTKLREFEENERGFRKKIGELEVVNVEEKKRMELIRTSEREEFTEICNSHKVEMQKFLKEIEDLKEEKKRLEDERIDVFRTLAGKEEEIKTTKQFIDNYKLKLVELQSQLNEKTINTQRLNEEKINLEIKIEENEKQISQIGKDLETARAESSSKTLKLADTEEAKLNLVRELEESEQKKEEIMRQYGQLEEDFTRQVANLTKKITESSSEFLALKKEYEIIFAKSNSDSAEIERLKTELAQSNVQLKKAEMKFEDYNQKLSRMDSSKDYEVGNLRSQLEQLKEEMNEKVNNGNAAYQALKLEYNELQQKYENNRNENKENSDSHSAKVTKLNLTLTELQRENTRYLQEKQELEKRLNSSEEKLKKINESERESKSKLQKTEEDLKAARRVIHELEKKNDVESRKDERIRSMQMNLDEVKSRAKSFQEKYYANDIELNEEIRRLQRDLKTAKEEADEYKKKSSKFNDLQKELQIAQEFERKYYDLQNIEKEKSEKLQKSLDESEKRMKGLERKSGRVSAKKLQEIEEKYKTVLEEEKVKYLEVQKQLEESEKKAMEYEQKYKDTENQGEELTKKLEEMVNKLQDPVILSPSSWKKPPLSMIKKANIAIRKDEILSPGTVKQQPMQPPTTPKIPKLPGKSILKSPKASPTSVTKGMISKPVKLSPIRAPSASPKTSPSLNRQTLSMDNTRPSSPDSCTMDIDNDDEDDVVMKDVLYRLSDSYKRDESGALTPSSRNVNPTTDRKFFKSRASQPK